MDLDGMIFNYCCLCLGEQAIVVEEGFEQISGFPRVIGAVDGCHVPIRTPSEYPQSYLNRLKSHSIILQVRKNLAIASE